MFLSLPSVSIFGLEGQPLTIELDISKGIPAFSIVGLPDAAIQESRERIRSALRNSGYSLPRDKIVVNLAPASFRKSGPIFDLPIALGIIQYLEKDWEDRLEKMLIVGELGLDGLIRPVNSILPMMVFAKEQGIRTVIIPEDNTSEAAIIPGIEVIGVKTLLDCVCYLDGVKDITPTPTHTIEQHHHLFSTKFEDIIGQESAKKALTVAAAGGHNLLMEGPPGSGKTMLAKGLQSILPDMSYEEVVEVSKIHSVAGLLNKEHPLVSQRPFRKVHHTASGISIIGGGRLSGPGEISLAHRGILFLDELLEFPGPVLETLRQPLEDGEITINRAQASCTYPAECMLVCTLNPCPCGFYGDQEKPCTCQNFAIEKYRSKLSGPLLDRIDIVLSVPRIDIQKHRDSQKVIQTSSDIQASVTHLRAMQSHRFKEELFSLNAHMEHAHIKKYCRFGGTALDVLDQATKKLHLSTRVYVRTIRIAQTIADLHGKGQIGETEIMQALGYRKNW